MSEPKSLSTASYLNTFKKVLLIGDSGTGKTHILGTFPKPIFIADFDGGLETLVGEEGIVYERYEGVQGWKEFRKELDKWCLQGPQYGCTTFAVDSLTLMADAVFEFVLNKAGRAQAQIADWGEAITTVRKVLSDLAVRMQCHTAMTAHVQVEKDETLGSLVWQPLIYGKELPGKVPAYFSEVYYTNVTTKTEGGKQVVQYRMQVVPDGRFKFVKSRMNKDAKVFEQFEEPDFSKLINKAQAYHTKENK